MKFTLTVDCDGAAFTVESPDDLNGTPDPVPELARILRAAADTLEARFPAGSADRTRLAQHGLWRLLDINGNQVGTAHFDDSWH